MATRSDYLRNLRKKGRARRTPEEQAELDAADLEKTLPLKPTADDEPFMPPRPTPPGEGMLSREEILRRLREKPKPPPKPRTKKEMDSSDVARWRYNKELAEPRLPQLFPELTMPQDDVIAFDDDVPGSAGPDVYDQEFEEWYLLGTPKGASEREREERRLEFEETPRLTAIRLMRENEKLTNAILSSFQRNHPQEYKQIVEATRKRIVEGKESPIDVAPEAIVGAGGRKRGGNEGDDDEPQEGRRTPQRQAPVMTPPSAGQDEERRNRRRLTPPSEDEFIDRACLYTISAFIGDDVSKSEDFPEQLVQQMAIAAEGGAGLFFFDQGVERAVQDLVEIHTEPVAACVVCGKEEGPEEGSLLRCSACKQVHYCGAECQKSDWNAVHKNECAKLIAGKDDEETLSGNSGEQKKKIQTTLLRRPFGVTSRGSQHAQIVIDKDRAARARAIMRASDEAKKKQQQENDARGALSAKEEARMRERSYQEATIFMHFTDQAVVTLEGRRYGSAQDTVSGERPVTQLTSLVTYAGPYVFRDGRYRFLQGREGDAYRRKYPTERGKTSSAPWEQYDPKTRTWVKIVGHPESASGWAVYIK